MILTIDQAAAARVAKTLKRPMQAKPRRRGYSRAEAWERAANIWQLERNAYKNCFHVVGLLGGRPNFRHHSATIEWDYDQIVITAERDSITLRAMDCRHGEFGRLLTEICKLAAKENL